MIIAQAFPDILSGPARSINDSDIAPSTSYNTVIAIYAAAQRSDSQQQAAHTLLRLQQIIGKHRRRNGASFRPPGTALCNMGPVP